MKKGITLIEILVASLIAVISITGSLLCLNQYRKMSIDAAYYQEAETIAKFILESNNRSAPSTLIELATDFPLGDKVNFEKISSTAVNSISKDYMITYSAKFVALGTVSPGSIEFTTQVDWINTSGNRKSLSLATRCWQLIL